ncbi:MAG TPA: pitrilysin family protein [Polyangiaceae bacterium]|nr:pitrilysin family protein [Polyangiaceae bacterium]
MSRVLGSAWALCLACSGSQAAAPAAPSAEAAASTPAAAAGPDRSALPQPGPPATWAPPAPTSWKLGPSSRVLYRKYGQVPLVSLNLVLPRGSETDPVGKDGLTSMMADLLDEGAGKLDALALSERLQALATDLRIVASTDAIQITMQMIAENFAPSIDILADVVRRPRLEEKEFQRRKSQLIAQAIASEADPHFGRRTAMARALFGKGYGGALPTGTRDTLEAISYADVKAHYKRLVVGDNATFVVVGGIEQDAVADQLKRAFGDWAGQATGEARAVAPAPGVGKLFFVNYGGAAQSVIGVMRRAPGADAEDLFPSTIFNRSFGEAFTSRVNLNLREDKGYTYGAVSLFQRYRQAGFFGVFSDVRSDVTRQSLDEVLRELSDICGPRPLAAQERDDSVGGLLLGYPATFESIELLGARFSQIPIYNRPLDWFERWPSRIAAVTLEQANQAAHSYCQKSDFSIVVAGDAAKVVPTLDGIGFELVKVDAKGQPL